jgi:hypothetical protein
VARGDVPGGHPPLNLRRPLRDGALAQQPVAGGIVKMINLKTSHHNNHTCLQIQKLSMEYGAKAYTDASQGFAAPLAG